MAVLTGSVVAGATASILYQNTTYRNQQVTFTTHGNAADVYVGANTVTPTSNGVVFAKSLTYTVVVPAGETLYCAGNATDTVKFLAFV